MPDILYDILPLAADQLPQHASISTCPHCRRGVCGKVPDPYRIFLAVCACIRGRHDLESAHDRLHIGSSYAAIWERPQPNAIKTLAEHIEEVERMLRSAAVKEARRLRLKTQAAEEKKGLEEEAEEVDHKRPVHEWARNTPAACALYVLVRDALFHCEGVKLPTAHSPPNLSSMIPSQNFSGEEALWAGPVSSRMPAVLVLQRRLEPDVNAGPVVPPALVCSGMAPIARYPPSFPASPVWQTSFSDAAPLHAHPPWCQYGFPNNPPHLEAPMPFAVHRFTGFPGQAHLSQWPGAPLPSSSAGSESTYPIHSPQTEVVVTTSPSISQRGFHGHATPDFETDQSEHGPLTSYSTHTQNQNWNGGSNGLTPVSDQCWPQAEARTEFTQENPGSSGSGSTEAETAWPIENAPEPSFASVVANEPPALTVPGAPRLAHRPLPPSAAISEAPAPAPTSDSMKRRPAILFRQLPSNHPWP